MNASAIADVPPTLDTRGARFHLCAMPSERMEKLLHLYKGLVEVSALINGITDSEELMPAILDVARRVFDVEAASLFLTNDGGELVLSCAAGLGEIGRTRIVVPRGQGISGWVLEHRQPLLVPDAYADSRFYRDADRQTGYRTRSILCVPLTRDDADIGVLQVLNPVGREQFDQADLEAFSAYGNLAATAIDKLRTIRRQQEQERAARDSAIARDIQKSFLPQTLPQRDEISFAASYRPAFNVGGDFYDVIALGPDELYLVIGDVSGKGTPAALLMAQALSTLRLILVPGISPMTVLSRWNETLCGHTIRGMFVTAIVGRVVPSLRHIELSSAGHPSPLRVRAGGGASEERTPAVPPLGILPGIPGRSHQFTLERGEWLVFFTDGLTESFNPEDQPLDRQGVESLLNQKFSSARELVAALEDGEARHRRTAAPNDDLTILTLGLQ
jgi:sigma-B regulation protein RsbU (phosphoserine phosphatase)